MLCSLCSCREKKTGWKECDYKQQHTLKSKHKSNKLVLYAAAAATSTATSKYTKKNNTKLYPFNPNPLCTTHKQPPKNNNNKFARKKNLKLFFMYFLFSFRQTNNRIEVKRVV